MSWTDERVETLKKMWGEGQSASQIAKVLGGVTRNAVIGKVHRLGLSNRAGGAAPAAAPEKKSAQAEAPATPKAEVPAPKPEEKVIEVVAPVRKPVITERATLASEQNAVVFEVAIDANKPQIKAAVEELFGVKVKAVNTAITKGKVKRFRGQMGTRKDVKKAYVTVEEGNTIDVSTGL